MRIKGKKRRSSSYGTRSDQGQSPRDVIEYQWRDIEKPREPLTKLHTFRARGTDRVYYTNSKNEIIRNIKDSWHIKIFFWLKGLNITDSKKAVELWEESKKDPTKNIEKPYRYTFGFMEGTTYHKIGSIHESHSPKTRHITITYEKDLTCYNLPEIFFFTLSRWHFVIEKAFRSFPDVNMKNVIDGIFSSAYSNIICQSYFDYEDRFIAKGKTNNINITVNRLKKLNN